MIRSAMIAALLVAAPAHADVFGARTEHVRTTDLDLKSDTGRATLDRRLRGAISRVCYPVGMDTLNAMTAQRRCIRETTPRVDRQMAALGILPGGERVMLAAR